MKNDLSPNGNIQLSLPLNAAYVSAARLTASSIANRFAFNIDEIEDIKAAVSEACTFLIKKLGNTGGDFTIVFDPSRDLMRITVKAAGTLVCGRVDEEMGLVMIRALMDSFDLSFGIDGVLIVMLKKHRKICFD
ncbi:MAG: serine/threonine protein kinase [Clostridiales bacterium]|jgi:serine/threonine-protein kinase RsbW|nr:serine/threonine protein kinase [Clostridiales bacterium]